MDQNVAAQEKHAMLLTRDGGLAVLYKQFSLAMERCAAMKDDTDPAKKAEVVEKTENAIQMCMVYLRLKQKKWLGRGGVNAVKAMTAQERLHFRQEGSLFCDMVGAKKQVKIALAKLGGKSPVQNHTDSSNESQVVSMRRLLKPRRRWLKKTM